MIFPPTIRLFLVPLINSCKKEYLNAYSEQPGGRTIFLDPRTKFNMVRLLIHEVLHVQHPSWSEHKTETETTKKYKAMGWKARATLLTSAFSRAHVGWPPKEDKENE